MSCHFGGRLFLYLSEATESSTALRVKVAAWQVIFLLADRWPDVVDLSFLEKALTGIKVLCDREPLTNLPKDFASQGEFGDATIICPKGGNGFIVLKDSEMLWAAWRNVELDFEDKTLKIGLKDGSDEQMALPVTDWKWCFENVPRS